MSADEQLDKFFNRSLKIYKKVIISSPILLKNYISGNTSSIDKVNLNINDLNMKRLFYDKEVSNNLSKKNQYTEKISEDRKWVPIEIQNKKGLIKAKARIKGHAIEHWDANFSLKIKTKKDNYYNGMRRFAIQTADDRGFLNEWLFHKYLKYNNLINLKYFFIQPSINGKKHKVYSVEENFDDLLLDRNKKKDGLIFRITNKDKIIKYQKNTNKEKFIKHKKYLEKNIKLFFEKKLSADLLFDFESMAKIFAISELWGNKHAIHSSQLRFYFNPDTLLIEPIGYDMSLSYHINKYGILLSKNYYEKFIKNSKNNYIEFLLEDLSFRSELQKEIVKITKKKDLEIFLNNNENAIQNNLRKLYRSYWYLDIKVQRDETWSKYFPFDINTLFENQKIVKKKYEDDFLKIENKINEIIKFKINNFLNINAEIIENYNKTEKILRLKKEVNIYKDLIIPSYFNTVLFQRGSNINFYNNSNFTSYSRIIVSGSEKEKTKFNSYGKNSITIINTKKLNKIRYSEFNNFDETNLKTGAITIYKSPILIHNSSFKNSNSEDNLNIVDSKFEIVDVVIENSKNDALDIDFSVGEINKLFVKNSGNDGLDFSKSEVQADEINIINSGDKGISVGEKSNIKLSNITIVNSYIGLSVKDESNVLIDKNIFAVSDSSYCLALYQKKKQFGYPQVKILRESDLDFKNCKKKLMIENNSNLIIENKMYNKTIQNVFKKIYPPK